MRSICNNLLEHKQPWSFTAQLLMETHQRGNMWYMHCILNTDLFETRQHISNQQAFLSPNTSLQNTTQNVITVFILEYKYCQICFQFDCFVNIIVTLNPSLIYLTPHASTPKSLMDVLSKAYHRHNMFVMIQRSWVRTAIGMNLRLRCPVCVGLKPKISIASASVSESPWSSIQNH